MPLPLEHLAFTFIKAGGRYECEELRTGEVSLTAVHEVEGQDDDIAIEVCTNDEKVVASVERLVHKSIAWLDLNG